MVGQCCFLSLLSFGIIDICLHENFFFFMKPRPKHHDDDSDEDDKIIEMVSSISTAM